MYDTCGKLCEYFKRIEILFGFHKLMNDKLTTKFIKLPIYVKDYDINM